VLPPTALNPQLPTSSLNFQYVQPLWRGLRYDSNRHSIDVARKNRSLLFRSEPEQDSGMKVNTDSGMKPNGFGRSRNRVACLFKPCYDP
jgi:hypothetical protein